MILHRALLLMKCVYVVVPLPSWHHRDSFATNAFATNFCQHICSLAGTVHSGTVLYLSLVIDEFRDVLLRENFTGVLVLPRAGGHQL